MITLTLQQNKAYQFIVSYMQENQTQTGPSYQEIADHLGLASKSGAHRLVHGLVARGRLIKVEGKHRAYEINGDAQ